MARSAERTWVAAESAGSGPSVLGIPDAAASPSRHEGGGPSVMCVNCVTVADALVLQGTAAAAAASGGWTRLRWWWSGQPSNERRRLNRVQAEAFLRTLDLDPEVVLGRDPAR